MNYCEICIDVKNLDEIKTGICVKQFDCGNDAIKVFCVDGESNFNFTDFDVILVKLLRADGKVIDSKIDIPTDDYFVYELGYFETFAAGNSAVEFSFVKFGENKCILRHLTLARLRFDVVKSISSFNVIEKRDYEKEHCIYIG